MKRKSLAHRLTIWVAAALVLALAIGTAIYLAFFSSHGLPGASAAGASATGQTKEELAQSIENRAEQTNVTLQIDDHSRDFSLAELGITVDAQATADQVFAANQSLADRISAIFQKRDTPVVMTVDETKADTVVADLISEFGVPAKNAAVKLAEDQASFTVDPAQEGSGVEIGELSSAATTAAQTLTSQKVELSTNQVTPATTTEQAEAIAAKANELVALDVTLNGHESDLYQADTLDKAQWITIPASDDGVLGEPTVDREKVAAWVQSTGAASSVEAVDGVRNVNASGSVLSTSQEGKDGWQVNNVDQVVDALVGAMDAAEPYEGTFDYDKVEASYEDKVIAEGAQDLAYQAAPGERWIDVNLSTNSATAYEGATVVRGPMYFVPGMPGLETPTGQFNVYLKYETQTMRGTNLDGTSYVSPNIPWVTYFTGSIAFHGAPWRDSFGWSGVGGSHGCLNMPVADAQWIHGWAPMGSVVVSHY